MNELKKEGEKPITMERLDGSIDLMLDADYFQKTIPVHPEVKESANKKIGRPKKPTAVYYPLEYTNKLNPDIYIPGAKNKPKPKAPIVSLDGIPILTFQNVSVLIAPPNRGKSPFCDSFLSKVKNPECDALGIELGDVKKVVVIDNERSDEDVHRAFERMNKRAGRDLLDEDINAMLFSLRAVASPREKRRDIEQIIAIYRPDLLVIDGSGDLVLDPNNLSEAIELKTWYRKITSRYKLSIFTTLHPNKGTETARGHIGSELLREAESVLTIKKENNISTITTDFSGGKNRNSGEASTSFKWCDDSEMLVSCEGISKTKRVIKQDPDKLLSHDQIHDLVSYSFSGEILGYSTLVDRLKFAIKKDYPETLNTGDNKMKGFIKYLRANNYIKEDKTERYPKYIYLPK